MKTPTIDELIGKIIETRDGCRYIVVGKQGDVFALAHDGYVNLSGEYDENLDAKPFAWFTRDEEDEKFDIIKVYECNRGYLTSDLEEVGELIWERKDVKELTVADVENLVGCKVKIVK